MRGAVEGDGTPAGGPSCPQHLMGLRGLSGQYVDVLVEIAVARRGRTPASRAWTGMLVSSRNQRSTSSAWSKQAARAPMPVASAAPLGDE